MRTVVDKILGDIELGKQRSAGPGGGRRFAILRLKKLSGMGKVAAAAMHNLRERDTPNANEKLSPKNQILDGASTTAELLAQWHERAPDKVRKNAVHAVEYVMTGSPEKMASMSRDEQDAYFHDALDWLKSKHGPDNVLSAVVHRDERTPHLQAMVIPLDGRGNLNARELLGGPPGMRAMQTDFAERVGLDYGLERGIEGSKARHQTLQRFYDLPRKLDDIEFKVPDPKPGRVLGIGKESAEAYKARLQEHGDTALRAAAVQMYDDGLIKYQEATDRANETLSERTDLQKYLPIIHDLHRMLHVTGSMDSAGEKALEQYREHYDRFAPELREIADQLIGEMNEETVPERRERLRVEQQRDTLEQLAQLRLEFREYQLQRERALEEGKLQHQHELKKAREHCERVLASFAERSPNQQFVAESAQERAELVKAVKDSLSPNDKLLMERGDIAGLGHITDGNDTFARQILCEVKIIMCREKVPFSQEMTDNFGKHEHALWKEFKPPGQNLGLEL